MNALARKVGELLMHRGLLLVTAESCTGGWIAELVTSIPGSSGWFERGFVTYSNEAKCEMLGVQGDTLAARGAVSEEVAREMAEGALLRSRGDLAVAVTGIAGPDGGTSEKPVGAVWLAWAMRGQATRSTLGHFDGDRERVRRQAVAAALRGVVEILEAAPVVH